MKAAYERDFKALKRWSALPAWEALQPGRDWEAYVERLPRTSFFTQWFLKPLGKAKKQYAMTQAESGGILIVAAIKLYERENGKPPRVLSELTAGYLLTLPKDPFSGRNYVYKVRGSEWILYSVWDNLRDDGGAGATPHSYKKDKDFVFSSKRIPIKPPPS